MKPRTDLRSARNSAALRLFAAIFFAIGLFVFSGVERIAYILIFFILFMVWERHA